MNLVVGLRALHPVRDPVAAVGRSGAVGGVRRRLRRHHSRFCRKPQPAAAGWRQPGRCSACWRCGAAFSIPACRWPRCASSSSGAVPAAGLARLLLRRPFSLEYARLDPREAGWPPPLFLRVNYLVSGVWAAAFAAMAVADGAVTFDAGLPLYGSIAVSVIAPCRRRHLHPALSRAGSKNAAARSALLGSTASARLGSRRPFGRR